MHRAKKMGVRSTKWVVPNWNIPVKTIGFNYIQDTQKSLLPSDLNELMCSIVFNMQILLFIGFNYIAYYNLGTTCMLEVRKTISGIMNQQEIQSEYGRSQCISLFFQRFHTVTSSTPTTGNPQNYNPFPFLTASQSTLLKSFTINPNLPVTKNW